MQPSKSPVQSVFRLQQKVRTPKPEPKDRPEAAAASGGNEELRTAERKRQSGRRPLPEVRRTIEEPEFSEKRKGLKKKKPVKILFLGGVGEVGKNMTAIEYGNDIIVIDAGITFPNTEDMPGIDLVVPDITYLVQNRDKVRGVLLTHGHEDHIGGIPYLMKELNSGTPIYGTKLTLMLADNKIQEHRIQNVTERVVSPGDKVKLGVFEVEFINVNHSISGAVALAVRTPYGLIYHSGDFKIDLTPVSGKAIDLARIAEIGREGVLLYLGESTNIERMGYTMSETVVGTTLDHLFSENMNRRLIIATFASNIHRLQQIIDLAVKYRRKVALSGRSMFKVVDAAVKIGELKIPEGVLIEIERSKNLFDGELLIVSTGTQGEPMSALTRMASGDFNKVTIGSNDTIIISASPIPGNEKMIYRVINNLYKKGANVVYESLEKIHVSGHACQEEHKILHNLLNPRFFIPVHGEYRHLKRHALLAEELGMPERNILITEIGNCVELTDDSIRLGENFPAGTRLIDGEGFEDYGTSEVMKDRLRMSAEGIFSVAIAVTGNYVINDPVIECRGFVFAGNREEDREIRSVVCKAIEQYDYESGNKEELAAVVKKALKNYIFKKAKQSPLIVVSVLEV
ncbi:MAG TPA: ribonuclease J [Candidatus Scatosoma pullistercoris]|uniref:Ribonuclease J n=1 Tax=Candidatus Scatosoma pullistercoris TaxID=2840934 RepID=A0A9D1MDH4_9FIRM|nr:ribonuclease J [Candidatus Scatosoma pullistercoris]